MASFLILSREKRYEQVPNQSGVVKLLILQETCARKGVSRCRQKGGLADGLSAFGWPMAKQGILTLNVPHQVRPLSPINSERGLEKNKGQNDTSTRTAGEKMHDNE